MKIAVYSLTRDRLDFTKTCFTSLQSLAGYDYEHFIVDNGSKDGTVEWLKQEEQREGSHIKKVFYLPENVGISKASNMLLDEICRGKYDLVVKFDNDCLVKSENILKHILRVYENQPLYAAWVICSPKVEGIVNQPKRIRFIGRDGLRIGITGMVGGLFLVVPIQLYEKFRYDETLPKAWGQDDQFCDIMNKWGADIGYIENLTVEHYLTTDGQAKQYPDYFLRKHEETK